MMGLRCPGAICPDSCTNHYCLTIKNQRRTEQIMCPDTCTISNCIAKRNYRHMINILGYDISSVVMKYL